MNYEVANVTSEPWTHHSVGTASDRPRAAGGMGDGRHTNLALVSPHRREMNDVSTRKRKTEIQLIPIGGMNHRTNQSPFHSPIKYVPSFISHIQAIRSTRKKGSLT